MSSLQCRATSTDQSTPFSRIERANLAPVSDGARTLLSQLVKWSGKKGYCYWSLPKIAVKFSRSESTIRRRKQELIRTGLLTELPRPGRTSYLIPFPDEYQGSLGNIDSDPLPPLTPPIGKEKGKRKRCTVEEHSTSTQQAPPSPDPVEINVNAIQISDPIQQPTPKPVQPQVPIEDPEPLLSPPPKANLGYGNHSCILLQ
ncbi:helix-turn-helix domain-containing protein [Thermodesulfobacteriota bacterium]